MRGIGTVHAGDSRRPDSNANMLNKELYAHFKRHGATHTVYRGADGQLYLDLPINTAVQRPWAVVRFLVRGL